MEETIYQQAIKKFGVDKQVDMLIEEMAELTQALLKVRRYPNDIHRLDNVHEEFADVTIVMRQIETLLFKEQLSEMIAHKEIKLEQKINQP